MCGKLTAMASWAEVVSFSQSLSRDQMMPSDNDREITFRVMSNLPVIIWDKQAGKRDDLFARMDVRRAKPMVADPDSLF